MGVTLERVQFKFASIIGELCSEPDILSQFAVWVDLRLAEYKLKGSISLDCSGESPDPVWLKGIKSAILEKALSLRTASGGDIGRTGPVRSPKPHTASRATNSARDSRGPSTPSVEQRLSPVVIKEEPTDVFPVSIHRSKTDSRKRPITDTECGDRDLLNSTSSPNKQSRLEANPENESLMSIIGMDSAEDETPEIAEVSQENIAREIDYLISQNAAEKAEQDTTQMLGDSSYSSPYPSTSSQGANNNAKQVVFVKPVREEKAWKDLRKEQIAQRQLLMRILNKDNEVPEKESMMEELLPVNSFEDLDAVEEKLADRSVKNGLVQELSLIGGLTVKDTVRRTMSKAVGHSVALRLNWAGKRGWKGENTVVKRAFGGLNLCETIRMAVMKNPQLSVTCDEVDRAMMMWLRYTADRHGGRRMREARKRAMGGESSHD